MALRGCIYDEPGPAGEASGSADPVPPVGDRRGVPATERLRLPPRPRPARRDDGNDSATVPRRCAVQDDHVRLTQSVVGDTIRVAAGEYDELVRIDLEGSRRGLRRLTTTVIGPAACAGIEPHSSSSVGCDPAGARVGGCPEGIVAAGGRITVESDLFLATGVGVSLAGGSLPC